MNLLQIAHVPAISVGQDDTVMHAMDVSIPARVGAVAVLDGDALVGMFTERDLMSKVVHRGLDPKATIVRDVMTAPVTIVGREAACREVLQLMLDNHIRHLPISEDGRTVEGILSIRNILQYMVEDLTEDLHSMAAFLNADSVGG